MSYLENQMDRRCGEMRERREGKYLRLCCLRKAKERGGETTNWRYVFQRKVHVMRLKSFDKIAQGK